MLSERAMILVRRLWKLILSNRTTTGWHCKECGNTEYTCHGFGADVLVCNRCHATEAA